MRKSEVSASLTRRQFIPCRSCP